jgi:hypothetical protein
MLVNLKVANHAHAESTLLSVLYQLLASVKYIYKLTVIVRHLSSLFTIVHRLRPKNASSLHDSHVGIRYTWL